MSDALARAETLLEAGQPASARALFADCLASHPDDPRALRGLAQAALELGDAATAAETAGQAVAAAPDDEHALRILAAAQAQLGQRDSARATADRAVAIAPELWVAHLQRATVDVIVGSTSAAGQRSAERALELAPEDPEAMLVLIAHDVLRGRRRSARRRSRQALALHPTHPELQQLHHTLGLSLLSNNARASAHLLDGVADDPDSSTIPQLLAAIAYANLVPVHLLLFAATMSLQAIFGIDARILADGTLGRAPLIPADPHAVLTGHAIFAGVICGIFASLFFWNLGSRGLRLFRSVPRSLLVWTIGIGCYALVLIAAPFLPLQIAGLLLAAARLLLLGSVIAAVIALRRIGKPEKTG